MTNQVSHKRKASSSSPIDIVLPSLSNYTHLPKKEDIISYPIFTAEYDYTPLLSTYTSTSPSSLSPTAPPYKRPFHFRRLPPNYPHRQNPSLRRRRKTRYAGITKSRARTSANTAVRGTPRVATSTSPELYSNSYEHYLQSLLVKTPDWLRNERVRPRKGTWDTVARTPESIQIFYMSREEYRAWRKQKIEMMRREQEIWNAGGVMELMEVQPQTVAVEAVSEESGEGLASPEKSWTCRMQ